MLEPNEIRSQLIELGLRNSSIVECHLVDNCPSMDWVLYDTRENFGDFHDRLADNLFQLLRDDEERKLVMLCDTRESYEYPVSGEIASIISCLFTLIRSDGLRNLLFKQPKRLIIATIEDGKIVVQDGQGEQMLAILRNRGVVLSFKPQGM